MAKGKNNFNGNDYIDQLQWRAQHRRRVPIRFEPKWKHKIVYRFPEMSPLGKIIQFTLLATVLFIFVKSILSSLHSENITGIIIVGSIFTLIVIILFFSIRDISKDDESNNIDK